MLDGVFVDVLPDLVAAILELPVDVLGEVGLVVPVGEVARRRPRLGADQHHDVRLAGGDRGAELGDELLRTLAADGLEHRAGRLRAEPLHHRPRIVVRLAQPRGHRAGDLELPQPEHGVDGLGDVVCVGAGVGQRGLGRLGGQLDRRHAPVVGVVDALGELADADEDRGPRVDHYRPPDDC